MWGKTRDLTEVAFGLYSEVGLRITAKGIFFGAYGILFVRIADRNEGGQWN